MLFTIQSPYWFTIGRQIVFSLGRWSALLHAGFHESDATLEHPDCFRIHLQDCHLLWCDFPDASISTRQSYGVRNPRPKPGLGYFRFRSPLLTESISLSFPAGNEMFQFPAFALPTLYIQVGVTGSSPARFPDSEIHGSMPVCRLPVAYRRLQRPSSPLDAKTSTLHP